MMLKEIRTVKELKEAIERIDRAEEKRVGDIRRECIKRGCEEHFLGAFDTRIWLYPLRQTKGFVEVIEGINFSKRDEYTVESAKTQFKMWKIYLQVLLEKRPEHEMVDEWREALKLTEEKLKEYGLSCDIVEGEK